MTERPVRIGSKVRKEARKILEGRDPRKERIHVPKPGTRSHKHLAVMSQGSK